MTSGDRQGHAGLTMTGRDMHGQEATGRNRYEQARIGMKGQAGSDSNRQGWWGTRDRQRQVVTGAGPEGTDRDSLRQAGTARDKQGQPETSRDSQ